MQIPDSGDDRGSGFSAPAEALNYVGRAADVHLASTKPGALRGNHYHAKRRAVMVVLPGSKWSFHWDEGEGTTVQHRVFGGDCAILIEIGVGASHALRNEGDSVLWYASISSAPYDPAENIARKVL